MDVVLSREQLTRTVLGYSHTGYERTVDTHIARVRRKFEAAGAARSPFSTLHGAGYRFDPYD